MSKILLTKEQTATVDSSDFLAINKYKWYAQKNKHTYYAVRYDRENKRFIYMHRYIMKTPNGMTTDHIDGNGLNNKHINLRICTYSQNALNRHRLSTKNKSGVRGVSWDRINEKWRADVRRDYKRINLGRFNTKNKAMNAVKKYASDSR